MRTKSVISMLLMTAAAVTISHSEAGAGFPAPPGLPSPPGVDVHINGYLPAPPGVHVYVEGDRPYYVERDRRIYMEREQPRKHYKNKHYKKEKKHHDDNGNHNGHYK